MNYWRMQLHPSDSARAVSHSMKSLGLGFIGLDFANPPGDLTDVAQSDIERGQRDYWEFAHTMEIGDVVLVVAHHFPCALAEVIGDYNYIRNPRTELGVWFRHFRRVKVLSYYADFVKDPASWVQTTMTDTISILRDTDGTSYQLIREWMREIG
jgi:hypothetical protein